MCPGEKEPFGNIPAYRVLFSVIKFCLRKIYFTFTGALSDLGMGRGERMVIKKLEHPLSFPSHIRGQKRLKNSLEGHKQGTSADSKNLDLIIR